MDQLFQKGHIIWSVCAFGDNELDCMIEAVTHGGNVRIGFENNHHLKDKSIAMSNATLITQFVNEVKRAGIPRTIATTTETRHIYKKSISK